MTSLVIAGMADDYNILEQSWMSHSDGIKDGRFDFTIELRVGHNLIWFDGDHLFDRFELDEELQ